MFHFSYPINEESELPSMYIPFPPFVAEQEVKEREEKERVEAEIYSPPSIYTPPPHPNAEHKVNSIDSSVIVEEDEERVTEITPPFPDSFVEWQLLNVA